jgi:hypothetical protein
MGINWRCTMDVAIRAANLLVAHDLFLQQDAEGRLDAPFRSVFTQSISEHGNYIMRNLEWTPTLTTNHYLCDIAGLAFIAAYMPANANADQWLLFSIAELVSEVGKQFNPDGTNFEGATCYHRLSTEVTLYATALVMGLDSNRRQRLLRTRPLGWAGSSRASYDLAFEVIHEGFPPWYVERLCRAVTYLDRITKQNGEIPQVGDNDSGRFFRLTPCGEMLTAAQARNIYRNLDRYQHTEESTEYWDENQLVSGPVVAAGQALFANEGSSVTDGLFLCERSLVKGLARGSTLAFHGQELKNRQAPPYEAVDGLSFSKRKVYTAEPCSTSLSSGLQCFWYPDAGVCIFRSRRLFLFISAGPGKGHPSSGHAHNDKLSFELSLDGKDVVSDPGTYLYTALPDSRNEFRSVRAHATLSFGGLEQNAYATDVAGLFAMSNDAACTITGLGDTWAAFRLTCRDIIHCRRFEVLSSSVEVIDWANKPIEESVPFGYYCAGYGKMRMRS